VRDITPKRGIFEPSKAVKGKGMPSCACDLRLTYENYATNTSHSRITQERYVNSGLAEKQRRGEAEKLSDIESRVLRHHEKV